MNLLSQEKTSQVQTGFSLVEVALALGVLCVAVIPLLGLMSSGFQTLKDSNTEMRAAMIGQKILAAAQMVPFDDLDHDLNGKVIHLDYEGSETAQGEAVFHVETTVMQGGGFLGSSRLAKVVVRIDGPALGNAIYTLAGTIANMGDR